MECQRLPLHLNGLMNPQGRARVENKCLEHGPVVMLVESGAEISWSGWAHLNLEALEENRQGRRRQWEPGRRQPGDS